MPLVRLWWCGKTGTSEDLRRPKSRGELKPEPPSREELTYLYEKLSIEERDELLQCPADYCSARGRGDDQGVGAAVTVPCGGGVAGAAGRDLGQIGQPQAASEGEVDVEGRPRMDSQS